MERFAERAVFLDTKPVAYDEKCKMYFVDIDKSRFLEDTGS